MGLPIDGQVAYMLEFAHKNMISVFEKTSLFVMTVELKVVELRANNLVF